MEYSLHTLFVLQFYLAFTVIQNSMSLSMYPQCRMMLRFLLAALLGLASASLSVLPNGDSQDRSTGNCPEGWVDGTAVKLGCLFFNATAQLTWDDASSMCQMGSDSTLIDITTEEQLAFIQMELIALQLPTSSWWWTAGTDVGINGQWFWATTRADVDNFIWSTDQPRPDREDSNCLALPAGRDYLACNQPCDVERWIHTICQLK